MSKVQEAIFASGPSRLARFAFRSEDRLKVRFSVGRIMPDIDEDYRIAVVIRSFDDCDLSAPDVGQLTFENISNVRFGFSQVACFDVPFCRIVSHDGVIILAERGNVREPLRGRIFNVCRASGGGVDRRRAVFETQG